MQDQIFVLCCCLSTTAVKNTLTIYLVYIIRTLFRKQYAALRATSIVSLCVAMADMHTYLGSRTLHCQHTVSLKRKKFGTEVGIQ